jgi:acetoin utilization deacetylase AcuC-like enzyme
MPAALKVFYCDHHHFTLGSGHKFPIRKYALTRERLHGRGDMELLEAPFASVDTIGLVHCREYVNAFLDGTLEPAIIRRIGLPWSRGLVDRTLASVGGTLSATVAALESGCGATLAGGTHHAFRNEGAGFCVFNDLAIATEWLRASHSFTRIGIIDLDVHQGDGTAAIFSNDKGVFTLSLHGSSNFPFRKQKSSLDVGFPDAATDEEYLAALASALERVWAFDPQFVFYQSGVDGLRTDTLGRLALTMAGLAKRDELVFSSALSRRIPIAVTMGGGYSDPIEITAEAHAQTFETAAAIFTL